MVLDCLQGAAARYIDSAGWSMQDIGGEQIRAQKVRVLFSICSTTTQNIRDMQQAVRH